MNKTQLDYLKQLRKINREVRNDVNTTVLPVIRVCVSEYTLQPGGGTTDAVIQTFDGWADIISNVLSRIVERWNTPFRKYQAEQIAQGFVKAAISDADKRQDVSVNLYAGNDRLSNYLTAAASQNAKLIQSIPQKYLDQVANIVEGNMRQGMRPSHIEAQLARQFGVSERRAKLIARDQHSKIQGDVTKLRQESSGIKYFRWLDSHDQRVRHTHRTIANADVGFGKGVYRWDRLPKDEKGAPIYPGSPVNCRCVAVPVPDSMVRRKRR